MCNFVGRNMTGFEIIEGASEPRLNNSPGGLSVCHSRCFDIVFHRPYRYFSIALKVFFFSCPIPIQFSRVTGYGLKFVKM